MLALMRRKGQSIICDIGNGETIIIKLTRVDLGRVYLGIDAPPRVAVYREELAQGRPWVPKAGR